MVAVFEEQDVRLVNQSTSQLSFHLHHLLWSNTAQHSRSGYGPHNPVTFPLRAFNVTPRSRQLWQMHYKSKGAAVMKVWAELFVKRSLFVHQRFA